MKKCLKCGNKLILNKYGLNRKFCSLKCRTRFNAISFYHSHKDSEDFRKKRKDYFNFWRKKNRNHFNDLMRERNKLFQRKKRINYKLKGLCLRCGDIIDNKAHNNCSKCRAYYRLRAKIRKSRIKAQEQELTDGELFNIRHQF